jgi:alkylhydroperoxidase family enzyme
LVARDAPNPDVSEDHYDDLLQFEKSDRYTDREKAALRYTDAIVWNADFADDAMWGALHEHFTEPELVELGFFIALTSGQQRWIKTLDVDHREVLADTEAGLTTSIPE